MLCVGMMSITTTQLFEQIKDRKSNFNLINDQFDTEDYKGA